MRSSEFVVLVYLAYIVGLVWLWPISVRRRVSVTAVALADAAAVLWLSTARGEVWRVARDWMPGLHLVIGYWLSGVFFVAPSAALEARLAGLDDIVFTRLGLGRLATAGPRWLLEYLELSYLAVYPFVPLGFAVVFWGAPPGARDGFWTQVLLAGFICYGLHPWLQCRPPLSLGVHTAITTRRLTVRRLNLAILGRASVQANTVPSGHAATSAVIALSAGALVPGAMLPLSIVAASIAVASVVGRYHYAFDSVAGVLLAVVIWMTIG